MKWLAECSAATLREALRAVAPELGGYPVTVPGPAGKQDPLFHSGSEPLGDRFIVKFAWSRPAALRLANEIGVVTTLAREPKVPFLPEVVASSTDPLLLITRRVPGTSLFDAAGSIDPDRAARQLARFLAALHHPAARQRAEAAVGTLTGPQLPPASVQTLRARLGTWVRPDQHRTVTRWCDWADATQASSGPAVLVHGDLHGDNQVWDHDELRLVVDHARLTGSGCPTVTDGLDGFRDSNILLQRVGGGHPHFHPRTGGQKPNLTDPVLSTCEVCGIVASSSADWLTCGSAGVGEDLVCYH